ncbi:AAA family ATPase [Mycoplasma feriruminatoris]|nr:AAA family ATPase [Mycoplasma feriruminatoris]UKS53957.1 DEAD/DEAH box helicase family protein [Mycoplasma feriruminatoris]
MNKITYNDLTDEQKQMIELAKQGHNILVDACIGSGKTTAIQVLCDVLPNNLKILYLTFNKLLKLDAKSKIKTQNTKVTNYHGFAYGELKKRGIKTSAADAVKIFLEHKIDIDKYDVLILDEYQDINTEISDMLWIIKEKNPNIQIIAVGDLDQKIYDNTTLDVSKFIDSFIKDYKKVYFTNSFRMPKEHANMLGSIWHKTINGVNDKCKISYLNKNEVIEFLSTQEPKNILCLGSRYGSINYVLNQLEQKYPDKFNKKTVYASIKDDEQITEPKTTSAIFTTFDSSKGLEKPICVIFDFDIAYWTQRLNKKDTKYDILRNIFCVAASRGKNSIIFVKNDDELNNSLLKGTDIIESKYYVKKDFLECEADTYRISDMFDHKYDEDLEECLDLLDIKEIYSQDTTKIKIKSNDGLIDISPCIGIYQEASYFKKYDIKQEIEQFISTDRNTQAFAMKEFKKFIKKRNKIDDLILYFTYLDTGQIRYINQVKTPFISIEEEKAIHDRLSTVFKKQEQIQELCYSVLGKYKNGITIDIIGFADVIKDNTVYELKFVNELKRAHFLQTASYMLALKIPKGILWNVKNNTSYQIAIKDVEEFKKQVCKTITKRLNIE